MRAGELNRRIVIQIPKVTRDDYGDTNETWEDFATVWAEIITSGGREFYAAQKQNAETSAVFRIRYREGLNTRMRIKYGHRVFEILPPINDVEGKHKELLISAKEVM